MTRILVDPQSLPTELRSYLDDLVQRTCIVCGPHLVGIFAVGSIALGDYRHGRSDIDVTVVADPALPEPAVRELTESLAHPALPCPAPGLELVVYDSDFAAHPSDEAGYLMDFTTGPLLSNRTSFDPAQSPAFWYVIDRSIAHHTGRLLYGKPVQQVIAAPKQHALIAALAASVREHDTGKDHLSDNRVLNGCRAVAFCRADRWLPKRTAAQLIAMSEQDFQPLITAALHSFQRPRSAALPLPAADIHTFLTWVRDRVEDAARTIAAETPSNRGR